MSNNGERGASLRARTLRGMGWSSAAVVIKALLSLLVLALLARLLTPVDFGLIGIAWIFIMLGARFGLALVGPAIVQRAELTDGHIQVGVALSIIIAITMTALAWLLAPSIGAFFSEPAAARVLQVLSVIFIIEGVGSVPVHLLRRDLRFRELNTADLLAYAIGYGVTAVTLALQGFGVWSLVWGEIMHKAVYTIVALCYTHRLVYPRWATREATELLFMGAGFSLARSFEFIARQGGYFVVGRWLGATSLGYFTRANKLVVAPRNYFNHALFQVLFPAMSQRQQGTARLATIYQHGIEILALLALLVSVLLFLCAPEIVSVILGAQWGPVVVLLQILAFAVLFQMCDVLNLAAISALGAVYRQASRQALHAVLVVGGAWFASRWGLETVVVAIVAAQIIASLLLAQLTLSLLDISWRQLLRRLAPALWVGVWVVLPLWLVVQQTRTLSLPVGVLLFIEVVVWIASAIAAVYCAPAVARPESIRWIVTNMPFEVFGTPGDYLRNGLKWLMRDTRDPGRTGVG